MKIHRIGLAFLAMIAAFIMTTLIVTAAGCVTAQLTPKTSATLLVVNRHHRPVVVHILDDHGSAWRLGRVGTAEERCFRLPGYNGEVYLAAVNFWRYPSPAFNIRESEGWEWIVGRTHANFLRYAETMRGQIVRRNTVPWYKAKLKHHLTDWRPIVGLYPLDD